MGFRFQRRIKLFPGVTMNLSKSGTSLSMGQRGAKVTLGKNGVRKTIGLPGTGLSYSTYEPYSKKSSVSSGAAISVPVKTDRQKLDLGFFSKMFLSQDENNFVEGLKLFLQGDNTAALAALKKSYHLADAAFTAGFLALNTGDYKEAESAFMAARQHNTDLGHLYRKYQLSLTLELRVSEFVSIEVNPCLYSLNLGLVEFYQAKHENANAINLLMDLYKQNSNDIIMEISLAELVLAASSSDKAWLHTLAKITANLDNETPLHSALLYYKGMVLYNLGMTDGAVDVLIDAMRRKADRSSELLKAVRYRRGVIYQDTGRKALARGDFEKIYLEDPGYEDIGQRLGNI